MYLSELDGPRKGSRQAAIDGHVEIGRRCRELGVDTIVVFDTHWLVNASYHVNCAPQFNGTYTSNELPHFISNMPVAFPGNPALGELLAREGKRQGVDTLAHPATTLGPEYGTLVPMRYMNADQHFKVISISGWCMWHDLHESGRFGAAVRQAIEERYDGTVAVWSPLALNASAFGGAVAFGFSVAAILLLAIALVFPGQAAVVPAFIAGVLAIAAVSLPVFLPVVAPFLAIGLREYQADSGD